MPCFCFRLTTGASVRNGRGRCKGTQVGLDIRRKAWAMQDRILRSHKPSYSPCTRIKLAGAEERITCRSGNGQRGRRRQDRVCLALRDHQRVPSPLVTPSVTHVQCREALEMNLLEAGTHGTPLSTLLVHSPRSHLRSTLWEWSASCK